MQTQDKTLAIVDAAMTEAERAEFEADVLAIRAHIDSWIPAGLALRRIRDNRTYRATHDTFEQFCREALKYGRTYAHDLMASAAVADEMFAIANISALNEGQARALAKAPEEARVAVLERAAAGGKLTAKRIKDVVREMVEVAPEEPKPEEPKPEEPEPYRDADGMTQEDYEPSTLQLYEDAVADIDKLRDLVESMQVDDKDREIVKRVEHIHALEGRIQQLMRTGNIAEKTAKSGQSLLAKVRKQLGVERNSEILPAIRALQG